MLPGSDYTEWARLLPVSKRLAHPKIFTSTEYVAGKINKKISPLYMKRFRNGGGRAVAE